MIKSKFWNQLMLFIIPFLAIVMVIRFCSLHLIKNEIDSYQTDTFICIGANLILIFYFLIKKNGFTKIAEIKRIKQEKSYLTSNIFSSIFGFARTFNGRNTSTIINIEQTLES
ncbi:hypothetical protein [Aquimarina longa]|uniref:hypothetical protein n=1 Tax=Aquimarina longa TaxID=1080221 RepID=UPI0007820414|nr:hypothetical protein [Aquimarina longa]